MTTYQQKIIKPRLGLLELAKELGNVSQACKVMGYSRDTFYRYKELHDQGGQEALYEMSKKKPCLKNRVPSSVEDAVINIALTFLLTVKKEPLTSFASLASSSLAAESDLSGCAMT